MQEESFSRTGWRLTNILGSGWGCVFQHDSDQARNQIEKQNELRAKSWKSLSKELKLIFKMCRSWRHVGKIRSKKDVINFVSNYNHFQEIIFSVHFKCSLQNRHIFPSQIHHFSHWSADTDFYIFSVQIFVAICKKKKYFERDPWIQRCVMFL